MIFDLFLIVIAIVAIVVAAHYRAKANVAGANTGAAVKGLMSTVSTELELMAGSLRAIIDHKFESMAKWLTTEIAKHVSTELAKVGSGVPAATALLPPDGPLAPITDDSAAQMLAQMESAISGLAEKKAKLEGVLKAKQQADNALREVLGE